MHPPLPVDGMHRGFYCRGVGAGRLRAKDVRSKIADYKPLFFGERSSHVMIPAGEHQLLVDMIKFPVLQHIIAAAVHLH